MYEDAERSLYCPATTASRLKNLLLNMSYSRKPVPITLF